MPKQIRAARPLLERLNREVPATLGAKPALLLWGMKDFAFRPKLLPQLLNRKISSNDHGAALAEVVPAHIHPPEELACGTVIHSC